MKTKTKANAHTKPRKAEFRRWPGRRERRGHWLLRPGPRALLYNVFTDVTLSIEVSVKRIKPGLKRWISS